MRPHDLAPDRRSDRHSCASRRSPKSKREWPMRRSPRDRLYHSITVRLSDRLLLNGENSRAEVQNVRAESSDVYSLARPPKKRILTVSSAR